MTAAHVRLERNTVAGTVYWRYVYRTDRGIRREGAGITGELSKAEQRRLIAAKVAALALDPLATMDAKDMTIEQWGARYIDTYPGAESSIGVIRGTLARLTAFFGKDCLLADIDEADAKNFVRALDAEQPALSLATIRKHTRNAKIIFGAACREPRRTGITANPFRWEKAGVPNLERESATVTLEQLDRILEHCPSPGWRCMFAIARLAGLRQQEIRRLTWGDIDFANHTIRVRKPKDRRGREQDDTTKHRSRVVPLQPRLGVLLQEAFQTAPEGSVGPTDDVPLDGREISKRGRKIVLAAGLNYPKPFHTLRDNIVNEWDEVVRSDVVAKWMGHSPRVKSKHYSKVEAADMAKIVDPQAEIEALRRRIAELESTKIAPKSQADQ